MRQDAVMALDTDDLRLLVDPSFRCAVALVHGVAPLLLELHLDGGRRLAVSHDPAFAPDLSPCQLRLAMAQSAAGTAPPWLGSVRGWSTGSPFVEPLGGGVVAHDGDDGRTASFATTLTPMVVRGLAEQVDTGGDDLSVVLRPDPSVGATLVQVHGDVAAVSLGGAVLAAGCRARERALRSARRG